MSYFASAQRKTFGIAGPDDPNRVTIRRMSFGVQQQAIGDATKITMSGGNVEEAKVDISADKLKTAQLLHCVVAWEGPDFDQPVSPEAILDLVPEVAERIIEESEAFNAPLTAEEKKGSAAR